MNITNNAKPARQWAAEIAALRSLDERRAALAAVPETIRPLVKTHLSIAWARRSKGRRL